MIGRHVGDMEKKYHCLVPVGPVLLCSSTLVGTILSAARPRAFF